MRYIQILGLILLLARPVAAQVVAQGAPGSLPWKINVYSATTIVPFPTSLGSDGGFKINWAEAGVLAVSGPLTDAQLRASAVPVSGTFWQVTQPVSGTFWQVTQPVSIATMPSTPVTGPLTDTQLRATPVPVSGTVTATTGGLTDTQLRASAVPVSLTTLPALTAGSAVIGHVIADTGSTTAVTGNVAVTSAGLTNLDVALSTRTKPADQQHTIIDSSAAIAVTGPLTDTQIRATPLPISGAVTVTGSATANAGTNLNTSLLALEAGGNLASVKTNTDKLDIALSTLRDALTGVSARTLTDAYTQLTTLITTLTNQQAIPGTTPLPTRLVLVGGQTADSPPQVQPVPLTYNGGAVRTVTTPNAPLLPLPPCNPVRRLNCQPKGF